MNGGFFDRAMSDFWVKLEPDKNKLSVWVEELMEKTGNKNKNNL